MLTRFGKFCRILRVNREEVLYDMAIKLNVSPAFLSKVENGKSKPPVEWLHIIKEKYDLSQTELLELNDSLFEARNNDSIDLSMYNSEDREDLLLFARRLNNKDIEIDKIKKLLNGR